MKNMPKYINYLIIISMIYIAVDLSSMVFSYKMIMIGKLTFFACSLIFPLTCTIMDIVSEVYGYQVAKKIILYGFICDFLFASIVLPISLIPSPTLTQTLSYHEVLGSLLRAVVAQSIGVLSGAFINIYLISKWKLLTNGKYFWIRSIGSSTLGEASMLIISVLIALTGIIPFHNLLNLLVYTYVYKVMFSIVIAPITSAAATYLKQIIGENELMARHDSNFYKTDFSPTIQET